jgi:hypothetical protein
MIVILRAAVVVRQIGAQPGQTSVATTGSTGSTGSHSRRMCHSRQNKLKRRAVASQGNKACLLSSWCIEDEAYHARRQGTRVSLGNQTHCAKHSFTRRTAARTPGLAFRPQPPISPIVHQLFTTPGSHAQRPCFAFGQVCKPQIWSRLDLAAV